MITSLHMSKESQYHLIPRIIESESDDFQLGPYHRVECDVTIVPTPECSPN